MAEFDLKEVSAREQADFKAEGRLRAYRALKTAFKKRKKENNVTIKSLAAAIGRDKGQISRVLSARSGVTLDTLVLLTAALGFRLEFEPKPIEEMHTKNWTAAPRSPQLTQPVTSSSNFHIVGDRSPTTSPTKAVIGNIWK
jgi:transcriptional regulator with XRE-family HTH domain